MSDLSTDGSGAEGAGQLRPSRRGRIEASGGRRGRKPTVAGAAARSGRGRRAHTGDDSNGRGGGGGDADRSEWPRILVQSLGAARVLVGDRAIGVHSELLLGLLLRVIYSAGMSVPRGVLLSEFWPGQSSVRQRGNLRQTLYKLRGLGVDISLNGETVELARSQVERSFCVTRDRLDFDRDVMRGSEPFGLFLTGYVPAFSQFEEWMEETREVVHGEVRRILVEVLRERRLRADWAGAEAWSRWLLQFDVLNEEATLTLAECLMVGGSKAEAVALLDRYMAELGQDAGDIRLPAQQLKRRLTEGSGVRRRKPKASSDRHFVGREEEMAELAPMLRRARWHDGSATLIYGPSGIGKTRLLQELGKVAQLEGYVQVHFDCRETDLERPLGVLLELLPELLNRPGALGCSPESMDVLKRLAGGGEVTLPVNETKTNSTSLSATRHQQSAIRHAYLDLLIAISEEKPLYLAIDDAEWLDDASWEVFVDICKHINGSRICLVVASRFSTIREARPAKIPHTIGQIRIQPLERDAAILLIKLICEEYVAEPSEAVMAWLLTSGEGTPLMIQLLIEHWVVTAQSSGVPPTLVGMIEHRLERLSTEALRALQVIALLDRYASIDRVAAVLQMPMHTLLQSLEQLEATDCLASKRTSLLVLHGMVAQVALSNIPKLVDALLRKAIFMVLEDEYMKIGDSQVLLGALLHLTGSDRDYELAPFIIANESQLLKSGNPTLILDSCVHARSTRLPPAIDRHLALLQSRLEVEAGEFGHALQRSVQTGRFDNDLATASENDCETTLTYIESAYRSDPFISRSELGRLAAEIVKRTDIAVDQQVRAADIGLIIASNICDASLAAECYAGLQATASPGDRMPEIDRLEIMYHTVFGELSIAISLAESVFQQTLGTEPTIHGITDCGRAGYVFRISGMMDQADSAFKRALSLADELNSPRRKEYPLWQLATIAIETGDIEQASIWTETLSAIALDNGEGTANDYLFGHLCQLAISQHNASAAWEYLDLCRERLPSLPPVRATAFTVGLELAVSLMDHSWIPSQALVEVAIARLSDTSRYCGADNLACAVADSLIRTNKSSEASALLKKYIIEQRRERSTLPPSLSRTASRLAILR